MTPSTTNYINSLPHAMRVGCRGEVRRAIEAGGKADAQKIIDRVVARYADAQKSEASDQ